MSEKYDAIVIGMGPSGIFFAYELIQLKKAKNIVILHKFYTNITIFCMHSYIFCKSSRIIC